MKNLWVDEQPREEERLFSKANQLYFVMTQKRGAGKTPRDFLVFLGDFPGSA
jgi:hypothetical protein